MMRCAKERAADVFRRAVAKKSQSVTLRAGELRRDGSSRREAVVVAAAAGRRGRGLRARMTCAAVAVVAAIALAGAPTLACADDADGSVRSDVDQAAASGSGAALASSSSAQSASGQSSSSSSSTVGGDSNRVDQSQRADNSFIYDTSIAALYSETWLYEGQTVQVVGEVVGDRITSETDPGFCWITVTEEQGDDSSSVSVLLSDELADQIDHYGKYNVRGTLLQVRGTFHEACSDHDGLSDIHATAADVSQKGWETSDDFDAHGLGIALVCVFVGCIIVGAYYYERERQR